MRGLSAFTRGARPSIAFTGATRAGIDAADDRGASLALVAISLVWMVGLASLVIDIGAGWTSRQGLIAATDAAALAGVQDLVANPLDSDGACVTARTYVADNAPAATITECSVEWFGTDGGRLTIGAGEDFEALLTDLDDETTIHSVSTATWGPPATVSALRPIAFCYDGSAELQQVIDHPPDAPAWVKVHYLRDDPSDCGGVSGIGNFATIDFAGGTAVGEIQDWVLGGYPEQIGFESPTTSGCDSAVTCYDRPYASGAIGDQLRSLQYSGDFVTFPIYDYADADELHLVGTIRARLYDFDITDPSNWWFKLQVGPGLVRGTCCGPPGVLAGNKVIAVCGVDPGEFDACAPEVGT